MKANPYFNSEHYPDPTAYQAVKNIMQEDLQLEKQVSDIVHVIKVICNLSGFEVVGRIKFRHKKSGREFE